MKNLFGNWKFFSNKKNTTKKQQKKGILTVNEKLRYVSAAQNIVHGMDTYLVKYLDSVRAMVDTSQIERNYTAQYKKYYQQFKESFHAVKQRAEKNKTKTFAYLAIFVTGGILLYIGIKKGFNYLCRQVKRFWSMVSSLGSSILQEVSGILDTTKLFLKRTFHVDIDIKQWLIKIAKGTVSAIGQVINVLLDGLWYLFCDTTAVQFIGQMLNQVAIAAYNASFDSAIGWVMNIFFSRVEGARRKIDLSKLSQYGVDTYSKIVGVQARFTKMLTNTENIKGAVHKNQGLGKGFWVDTRKDELVSMDSQWTFGWDGDASSWAADVNAHNERLREQLAKAVEADQYNSYSQGQFTLDFDYGQFGHSSYQEQSRWYEDGRQFDPNQALYMPTQESIQQGCPRAMDLVKQVDDFMYKYRNQKSKTFERLRNKWASLRFSIMRTYEQGYSQQFKVAKPQWKGGITYRQLRLLQALLYEIYIWQGKTLQKRIRMHDIMFHNRVQNSVIDKLLIAQQATIRSLRQKSPLDEIVDGYMGYRMSFKDAIMKAIDILKYASGVMQDGMDKDSMDSSYGQSGAKLMTRHQFDKLFGDKWLGLEMYKARNYFKRIFYLRKGWAKVHLVNDLEMNFDYSSQVVGDDNLVGGTHTAYSGNSQTGVRQSGDESAILANDKKSLLIFSVRQLIQNLDDYKRIEIQLRKKKNKLIRDCSQSIKNVFLIWDAEVGKKVTTDLSNAKIQEVEKQFNSKIEGRYSPIPLTYDPKSSSDTDLSSWQQYENNQRMLTCAKLDIPFEKLSLTSKVSPPK